MLSAVLAGPLVDRLGFKRASVLADIASGATVAAVPLLYGAGSSGSGSSLSWSSFCPASIRPEIEPVSL
jgi:hypothetical protein